QLVEPSALTLVVIPWVRSFRIHLPASLRSTGVTRFLRYYERSDSCRDQSSRQVSLLHKPNLPTIPPPTT
ncbi:MAG: hypothetical protein KDA68_18510, partial [Planctomycetaceae bacterium]|nr:hypothetical protein [Planctomycetaceae bacterium]